MSSLPRPDPGLEDDDGGADPRLMLVLASYGAGESRDADVLRVLTGVRLIVAVTAVPTETVIGPDGLVLDKTVEMALPVMVGTDGRRALPAFTSVAALAAWDPAARPVPVPTQRAALGAVQEGCAFLVVDPAGPVTWVADRAQIESLAGVLPDPAG
jgi:SseB protein N-terminal domain